MSQLRWPGSGREIHRSHIEGLMTTYRDSVGESYDDAEMENYFANNVVDLVNEDRAEITFAGWLQEMLSRGRFSASTSTSSIAPQQNGCTAALKAAGALRPADQNHPPVVPFVEPRASRRSISGVAG